MVEIWDAYDQNFNKIGNMTLVRGEPVPDGLFHLVCGIIVRHADGQYLIMRRDPDKPDKPFPGMWELSAGGSALAGETPYDCAVRELKEETGLSSGEMTELGRAVAADVHCLYVDYLFVTDCSKDSVKLQDGETVAYRWVDRDTLLGMDKSELLYKDSFNYIPELRRS